MAELQRGWTSENPVTGERSIVLEAPGDNPERRLVAELHLTPEAAVVGEHLHPAIDEHFEVLEGRLGVSLDGERSELGAGESVSVPAESWHDWWNVAPEGSIIKVDVTPGDRFVDMIRTLFGLANDGKVNAKGMPRFLQLVAIGVEFRDVIVFKKPPSAIQRVTFGLLAPIARARGYRGTYPRYAEAGSMGTAEDVRSGAPLRANFGDGAGPPR